MWTMILDLVLRQCWRLMISIFSRKFWNWRGLALTTVCRDIIYENNISVGYVDPITGIVCTDFLLAYSIWLATDLPTDWPIHRSTDRLTERPTHPPRRPPTHTPTHPLTHPRTHGPTHRPTNPPTHRSRPTDLSSTHRPPDWLTHRRTVSTYRRMVYRSDSS